eukprot:EG_transcript_42278
MPSPAYHAAEQVSGLSSHDGRIDAPSNTPVMLYAEDLEPERLAHNESDPPHFVRSSPRLNEINSHRPMVSFSDTAPDVELAISDLAVADFLGTFSGPRQGSPLYLEHVTYEVDYALPKATKNPFAKKVVAHKVILRDINAHV